jgi:hypothetical protein
VRSRAISIEAAIRPRPYAALPVLRDRELFRRLGREFEAVGGWTLAFLSGKGRPYGGGTGVCDFDGDTAVCSGVLPAGLEASGSGEE